jgi:hypothetical protein
LALLDPFAKAGFGGDRGASWSSSALRSADRSALLWPESRLYPRPLLGDSNPDTLLSESARLLAPRVALCSSSVKRRNVTFLSLSSCIFNLTLTGWLDVEPYRSFSEAASPPARAAAAKAARSPARLRRSDGRRWGRLSADEICDSVSECKMP